MVGSGPWEQNDCARDCAGAWGGSATLSSCGVCVHGNNASVCEEERVRVRVAVEGDSAAYVLALRHASYVYGLMCHLVDIVIVNIFTITRLVIVKDCDRDRSHITLLSRHISRYWDHDTTRHQPTSRDDCAHVIAIVIAIAATRKARAPAPRCSA